MTAADARSHLDQLESARAIAHVDGLDDQIDEWRRRYIATALDEFASLRAELSARYSAQPNVRPAVSAPSMM